MPILLLEGTRGAGKTALGTLLAQEASGEPTVNTGHAPIKFVPQRLTLGVVRPLHELGVLDDELARVLLGRLLDWVRRASIGERWLVLDTLHLTLWVRKMLGPATFAAVDDAMVRLGAQGVLLRASAETIRARRVRDDEARVAGWVSDQQVMLDLCDSSAIPWKIVDADSALSLVAADVRREILYPPVRAPEGPPTLDGPILELAPPPTPEGNAEEPVIVDPAEAD